MAREEEFSTTNTKNTLSVGGEGNEMQRWCGVHHPRGLMPSKRGFVPTKGVHPQQMGIHHYKGGSSPPKGVHPEQMGVHPHKGGSSQHPHCWYSVEELRGWQTHTERPPAAVACSLPAAL